MKYLGITQTNEFVLACFLLLCSTQKQLGTTGFISSSSASPPSTTEEIRAETQAGPRSIDYGGTQRCLLTGLVLEPESSRDVQHLVSIGEAKS